MNEKVLKTLEYNKILNMKPNYSLLKYEIFILISSREIRNILVWDKTREILFLYKFSSSLKFCGILLISLICFSIMGILLFFIN